MCQSRRFLDGHAHLNGPLGKIARFFPYFFKSCPFLCDFCNLKRCPGKQFQQHVVITAPTSERYLECYPTLVMQALQTSLTHQTASLAHCTAREYLTLTITSYYHYHCTLGNLTDKNPTSFCLEMMQFQSLVAHQISFITACWDPR